MKITPKPGAVSDAYRDLGISRDELSRRMGVSTATAYRIEMGRTDPSPAFIAALMVATGKRFEQLFDIVAGETTVSGSAA